jgi:hypothetical protein
MVQQKRWRTINRVYFASRNKNSTEENVSYILIFSQLRKYYSFIYIKILELCKFINNCLGNESSMNWIQVIDLKYLKKIKFRYRKNNVFFCLKKIEK